MTEANTKKRTTKAAYRLRARRNNNVAQDVQHNLLPPQRVRRQQQQWNGNGIGATNDSADYKPLIRIVNGLPVEYSCKDDPRRQSDFDPADLRIMTIQYDYEMATEPEADLDSNLRNLEWSVLWNVAKSLGLFTCNFQVQDPGDERRLQQQQQEAPPPPAAVVASENYVVGLSSLDSDTVDQSTDFCTFLSTNQEDTICTPIKGEMTVEYVGDEEIVERYLLSHIAKEMNSRRVRIEQVEEVRYVGDRENLLLLSEQRTDLDSKNAGTNIGVVVGVLLGLLVVVLALFLAKGKHHRKQRRRQQTYVQETGNEEDEDDCLAISTVQTPATDAKSDQAVAKEGDFDLADSGDTEESFPDRHDYDDDDDDEDDMNSETTQVSVQTKSVMVSTFDPNPEDQAQQPEPGVHHNTKAPKEEAKARSNSVPPLPPLSVIPVDESSNKKSEEEKAKKSDKSKTLATRRKRKKKKKKKQRVLKRVSSKSSINEMETIREDEEDENSSDDFEFEGSEYSTDDEDDWVATNSNDGGVQQQNGGSSSPGRNSVAVPPSPIQEEPKIRKLPPPWI